MKKMIFRWIVSSLTTLALFSLLIWFGVTSPPAQATSFRLIGSAPFSQPLLSMTQTSAPGKPSVTRFENRFTVSKDQRSAFLERWDEMGRYLKKQPGFLSAQLKKDISENEWLMSEEWESIDSYKRAVSSPDFQALLKDFPGKATWFAQDLFS